MTKAKVETQLPEREQLLVDLLWDFLKRDPEFKDRRRTAWGTKTKVGLVRSITRIVTGKDEVNV